MQKVNLGPFIDEIQSEISRALTETDFTKETERELEFERLDAIIRSQSKALAKQLRLSGEPIFLHMLTVGVVSMAWTAFELRRASMDDKRPFDVRLDLIEMANGLGNAISEIVTRSAAYADSYKKKSDWS